MFKYKKQYSKMFTFKSVIILSVLTLANCETLKDYAIHSSNFTKPNDDQIVDIEKYCRITPCIAKCCKEGEMFYRNKTTALCAKYSEISSIFSDGDYAKFAVNDNALNKIGNLNNFVDNKRLQFVNNEFFEESDCAHHLVGDLFGISYHVLEDSSLMMERANYYHRFTNKVPLSFCLDLIWYSKKKQLKPVYCLLNKKEELPDKAETEIVVKIGRYALVISSVFMVLLLLVYAALPQMRNIVGMVLMAYVATLTAVYLIRAIWQYDDVACGDKTKYYYYATVSSFFWLNVMSWDVWWTIRGTRKCRPIHRQGELMKFMWYGLYAWGVPMAITVAAYMIDTTDLSDKPHIVKPFFNQCLANKNETLLYLYVPILILVVFNCVLFLMTVYNLFMMKREMSSCLNSKDSKNNKNNENRFGVYLRISALMGISWLIELVNFFVDQVPLAVYIIMNSYNLFVGVAIFFIFVFKKDVLIKLCKRFNINNKFVRYLQPQASTQTDASTNKGSKRSKKSPSRDIENNQLTEITKD